MKKKNTFSFLSNKIVYNNFNDSKEKKGILPKTGTVNYSNLKCNLPKRLVK